MKNKFSNKSKKIGNQSNQTCYRLKTTNQNTKAFIYIHLETLF